MNFKYLFVSKEVRLALQTLDRVSRLFNGQSIEIVRKRIQDAVLADTKKFEEEIKDQASLEAWAFAAIYTVAGRLVISGRYHLYAGLLDPEEGGDLLRIIDKALDESVKIGKMTKKTAQETKRGIREEIKSAG